MIVTCSALLSLELRSSLLSLLLSWSDSDPAPPAGSGCPETESLFWTNWEWSLSSLLPFVNFPDFFVQFPINHLRSCTKCNECIIKYTNLVGQNLKYVIRVHAPLNRCPQHCTRPFEQVRPQRPKVFQRWYKCFAPRPRKSRGSSGRPWPWPSFVLCRHFFAKTLLRGFATSQVLEGSSQITFEILCFGGKTVSSTNIKFLVSI